MEKDPALRYQTASDLRADLKRLKRDSQSGPQALAPAPKPRKGLWIGLATAATLAAGAFLWLRPASAPPAQPAAEMTITSILNSQSAEVQPSISADGKSVAYAWDGEDGKNFNIYVKRIDSGNPLRLTNTPERELWPKWSPDGNYVAFMREKANRVQLLTVPALGGVERVLAEWERHHDVSNIPRNAYNWHPDGRHLVYPSPEVAGNPAGLILLHLDSGSTSRLTSVPPGSLFDSTPVFLSGGSKLAFARMLTATSGTVEVLTLADRTLRSYPVEGSVYGIAVAPTEKELLLDTNVLLRLRLDTGESRVIEPLLRSVINPSISADGRRMVFEQSTLDTNIWHVALDRPGQAGPPAQWIASTFAETDPRYSPTGEQILFVSTSSGSKKPWIADRQGRNAQMVVLKGPFFGSPNWSPDGGQISYDARIDGVAQVMVVPTQGGTLKQITSDKFENVVPSWSHDGQWLYYCSNRSGRQEIWRVRPNGGASEQVTQKVGFESQESRDGKYLYFSRSRSAPDIWRRTPDGTEELLVPDVAGRMWVAGQEGVYFVKAQDLMYLDLATRKRAKVLTFAKRVLQNERAIDLSPDGRELLWRQIDSFSSDIALVENFR